ncbi:MAG: hypothetical protein U0641_05165 [Anaerolineae bacterium]
MDNKKLQTELARITEELAYDRAALDELHGRLAEQTAEVVGVSQRLSEIVGDMTRTQTRLTQLDALQKAIGQVRTDLVGLMDEQSKRLNADVAAIRSQDAAHMERVTQLADIVQTLRDDHTAAARRLDGLAPRLDAETNRVAQIADLVQGLREAQDAAKTRLDRLAPRLDAETNRIAQLADLLQGVREAQETTKGRVEGVAARVDGHITETAQFSRALQEMEARVTGAENLVTDFESRVASQSAVMVELGRSIQALRTDLTATQSQLGKFPQIEEAVAQAKGELLHLVQGYRAGSQAEVQRIIEERNAERQATARALADMQAQIRAIEPLQPRVDHTEAEMARQNTLVAQLGARIDVLARDLAQKVEPIPSLGEQLEKQGTRLGVVERDVTAVDHKIDERTAVIPILDKTLTQTTTRVEKVEAVWPQHAQTLVELAARIKFWGEHSDRHADRLDLIEGELPKFARADAETAEKVDFLEDWIQRTGVRLDELQRFEDDLRRTLAEMVESEKIRDSRRDHQMAEWNVELAEHRQVLDGWRKVLRGYEEHHVGVTKQMADLDDMAKVIDQDQRAAAEAQRIEGEKLRREFGEWQRDVDKRWALFFKQRDWDWSQQKAANKSLGEEIEQLKAWRSTDVGSVTELASRLDAKDRELLMRIEDLWEIEEEGLRRSMTELKERLAEVEDSKARSPKPRAPKPGEKIIGADPRYRRP